MNNVPKQTIAMQFTEDEKRTLSEFAANYSIDSRIPKVVPGFDAPFFQAGLAGYSDAAMRILARRHGCPYCVTEALIDRLLLGGGRGRDRPDLRLLVKKMPELAEDTPLAGQIIGANPDEMAHGAGLLVEMGYGVIDVNLACPVKKMGRKCRGGHFLTQPQDAIDVLHAVRDAVPKHIPTTVKLRRGADDSKQAVVNFETIFNGVYELGYSWATVHCRTVTQKYQGPGDWSFLKDLTQRHQDKIIFGSGDIWTAYHIFSMLRDTNVQSVAVARGCIGNPWIFQQARQIMEGHPVTTPVIAEQRQVLLQHFDLCCAEHGEHTAGRLMRKFGIKFSEHHPNPECVKARFIKVKTLPDWRNVLDDLYPSELEA